MSASKETMPTGPGAFAWNELNTNDLPAAQAFYTRLFGWETDQYSQGGMECTLFRLGANRVGGMVVNPAGPDSPPMWLSYVRVADADAAIARANQLGGKTLIPPENIPNVGRIAVFQDPQGAILGVFQPLSA